MSNQRKAISKKVRFEVFKRDSFICQYCGQSAPDVVLHVDHIHPVSRGGDNDIMNLVTSCQPCNSGKSDRLISDNSVIEKQKAQLDELNEKRQQLEMMIEWRNNLKNFDQDVILRLAEYFESETGFEVNENGHASIKKWLKKFSFQELLDGIDGSINTYYKDGCHESTSIAFSKVPNVCSVIKRQKATGVDYSSAYYIRGIIRNKFNYVNDLIAIGMLKSALDSGVDADDLKDIALESKNWTVWRESMNNLGADE